MTRGVTQEHPAIDGMCRMRSAGHAGASRSGGGSSGTEQGAWTCHEGWRAIGRGGDGPWRTARGAATLPSQSPRRRRVPGTWRIWERRGALVQSTTRGARGGGAALPPRGRVRTGRGLTGRAPLRKVGQKRPSCRHARPDLPPRAAPRVSTSRGCCAAAPARVAAAPMQLREVQPRACRPPARCAAGERGGAWRAAPLVPPASSSAAPRPPHRAQIPARSAPAPGGTPTTFPSGISATHPPARAIQPPVPINKILNS